MGKIKIYDDKFVSLSYLIMQRIQHIVIISHCIIMVEIFFTHFLIWRVKKKKKNGEFFFFFFEPKK